MNVANSNAATPGMLYIPSESWEGVRSNIPMGSAVASHIIPFRYQSMKTLVTLLQPSTFKTTADAMAIGCYPRAELRSYQWRYGGKSFPARAIKCGQAGEYTEAYSELLNAMYG